MKDEDIKKIAEEYKKQFGKVTNKDLLFYLLKRLDDLDDDISKTDTKVEKNKYAIKIFYILLPIGLAVAGFIGRIIGM